MIARGEAGISVGTATESATVIAPLEGRKPGRSKWRIHTLARRRALISFTVVFVAWELAGRFLITNPLFFVPISQIFQTGYEMARTGELWLHTSTSLLEAVYGFAIAVVLGIAIGGLIAVSQRAREYIEPWVIALYATPTLALGPLFILWFGLGITSKIAIVVMIAVFPIIINTQAGLQNTDRNLIDAVRSFGASKWQIFAKVRMPSSLPFIMAGCRSAAALSLIGVVVAEFFGAREGLGYLIFVSSQNFDTAELFVGVFVLAGIGIIAVQVLKWAEARLAPWRIEEEK